MSIIQINLNSTHISKSSLQVGDVAYVSEMLPGNRIGDPERVGEITEINNSGVMVDDEQGKIGNTGGSSDQFLSFAKDIRANESSLKGYYAEVEFKNISNKYAELFAISSDIVPSSK